MKVKLLHVTNNLIDCFWNEGWEDWVRYEKLKDKEKGNSYLKFVSGKQPPKEVYFHIRDTIIGVIK